MNTEKELIEEIMKEVGLVDEIGNIDNSFEKFYPKVKSALYLAKAQALAEKGLIRIEDVEKIIDEFSEKKIKSTKEWEKVVRENLSFLEEIENYNKQLKQQLKKLGEKTK